MSGSDMPLVSVVTPTYNGEKYLAECVESVLRQSYTNWEYIIVNNCSKDRTLEIARRYADADPRIRVHDNSEFLTALQNHNHAVRLMSARSRYCKVLQADDWLYPECLERMVEVGERNPTVAIVGSYRLKGASVRGDGLPFESTVVPGREICRRTLLKELYVFGSPSTLLLRADVVRARDPFYSERSLHADVEACYEVLSDHDFGFVHQVLSFTRVHEESRSATLAQRYRTNIIENLGMLLQYGPRFLSEEEFRRVERDTVDKYYRFRATNLVRGRERRFVKEHDAICAEIGFSISRPRLAIAVLRELVDMVLNPKRTVEQFLP